MKQHNSRSQLTVIAALDIIALTLGIAGAMGSRKICGLELPGALGEGHPGFLSLAVAAAAVITFFGTLRLGATSSPPTEAHIRRAVAVAVVTLYLSVVGIATFYVPWEEFSEASKTLLTSFTATVGVIVAFFFGSSAYVEARTSKNREGGEPLQPRDDT